MFDRHRGAFEASPFQHPPDRRIVEIDQVLRETNPLDLLHQQLLSDPFSTIQAEQTRQAYQDHLFLGQVIHALPGLNWYKVQLGLGFGYIGASLADPQGGFLPLGPRSVAMIPPGSMVLVYKPLGVPEGIILGALPPITPVRGGGASPDYLTQGGNTGYKRDAAHYQPVIGLYEAGGVKDYAGGRPLDQTAFDRGVLAATGVGWNVNDLEAWIRVSEICGLWLNLLDHYTKLAGRQLDIYSGIHRTSLRDDEGEARYYRGVAAYPWEAVGLITSGISWLRSQTDHEVQYTKAQAKLEPDENLQPLHRYQEYGGYLGHLRQMILPAENTSGKRTYGDGGIDDGLFREWIGRDGDYSLVSAKSLYIGKRCKIAVPRELLPPEHPDGDDASADNYRFSGQFGDGPEHKVPETSTTADSPCYLRLAAVLDVVAHQLNWKAMHPFHYHARDFKTPNESEQTRFERASDILDYRSLGTQDRMTDPIGTVLRIDPRYGDVKYYERESFIKFFDNGSVGLGCGFGTLLAMTYGKMRLEAPGDIEVLPGRRLVVLGHEGILRFKGSVDITSATKDLRLKAERNLQVLAGNAGRGGLLLESHGAGTQQDYTGKIGEDVTGAGVIIRARGGVAGIIGDSVYIRSETDEITLDAAAGQSDIDLYARAVRAYTIDGLGVWLSTGQAHQLSNTVVLGADVTICGDTAADGDLVVGGDIAAGGNIAAVGCVADRVGGALAKTPASLGGQISSIVGNAAACCVALHADGAATLVAGPLVWYGSAEIGNATTLTDMAFSYRDDPAERQYGVGDLVFPETRWQQWARFGMAMGGVQWIEPAVHYQGAILYPWPGRKKWTQEPVLLRLAEHKLFDPATGQSRDRGAIFENPELGGWTATTMVAGYLLNK